jgi:hypothetical protein
VKSEEKTGGDRRATQEATPRGRRQKVRDVNGGLGRKNGLYRQGLPAQAAKVAGSVQTVRRRDDGGGMDTSASGASVVNAISAALPAEATSRVALKAWTGRVVGEVVDHSIEMARKNRERAAAEAAKREAQEARDQARAEENRRRREEVEAADARRLVETRTAEAERQKRIAVIQRGADGGIEVVG